MAAVQIGLRMAESYSVSQNGVSCLMLGVSRKGLVGFALKAKVLARLVTLDNCSEDGEEDTAGMLSEEFLVKVPATIGSCRSRGGQNTVTSLCQDSALPLETFSAP